MNELAISPNQTVMNAIEQTLLQLISERSRFTVRIGRMTQSLEQLQTRTGTENDEVWEEMLEKVIDQHDAVIKDLTTYVEGLDKELNLFRSGIVAARGVDDVDAKIMFLSYILASMNVRLEDARTNREGYTEVFDQLQMMAAHWI